jgi:hypothetical protein
MHDHVDALARGFRRGERIVVGDEAVEPHAVRARDLDRQRELVVAGLQRVGDVDLGERRAMDERTRDGLLEAQPSRALAGQLAGFVPCVLWHCRASLVKQPDTGGPQHVL